VYFGNISSKDYIQTHNLKGHGESFPLMWLNIGLYVEKSPKYVLPRFSFSPKTGIAFPKTGVLFLPYAANSQETTIRTMYLRQKTCYSGEMVRRQN